MKRVFVVEDHALLRDAVDMILTQAGFLVGTTGVAKGAINMLARFRPHIILLDIRLPDMSGLQVLSDLRAAGYTWPVVMMTADSRPETVQDVMSRGGNGYLLKPFQPEDLVARVRSAMRPPGDKAHYLDDLVHRVGSIACHPSAPIKRASGSLL